MKEVNLEKKRELYGKMILLYIKEMYSDNEFCQNIIESFYSNVINIDETLLIIYNQSDIKLNYTLFNWNTDNDNDLAYLYKKYAESREIINYKESGNYFNKILTKSKTIKFTEIKEKIPSELLVREEDDEYTH